MELRKHYTATGYVYDRHTDRFLLIQHRALGKWLPPGGHLLEGEEPHRGVLRELAEETGLEGSIVDLLRVPDVGTAAVEQLPAPFSILAEPIPAGRREEAHTHLDFLYVVEVDPAAALYLEEEEVALAKWIAVEDLETVETFDNVRRVCQAISVLSKQLLSEARR